MNAKRRSSTRSTLLALWVVATSLTVISCSTGSRPSAAPQTHTLVIRTSKFAPENLAVNVGDTVEFKNSDIVPHTATSTRTPAIFDSGRIGVGESWKYVARGRGTYDYECSFHPNMQGTIVVR